MSGLSDDEDASIDELSDSGADSDGGSLIDASPGSGTASPTLGGYRAAGRPGLASQAVAAPAPVGSPAHLPGASPDLRPRPGTSAQAGSSPHPAPAAAPDSESSSGASPERPGPAVAPPGGPVVAPPGGLVVAPLGGLAATDGAGGGERMDTANADGDSDIEILPADEADAEPDPEPGPAPAPRRSLGLWRETDFQPQGRGQPAAPTSPAVAAPPADDVAPAVATGPAEEHKTPTKTEGGGFLTGPEAPSPASEDGQCCTICFESWSNSGEHRIASLRCGHLFGKSCIERWLRGREQRCPQCNAKANRRDVRVIFAKSLRVLDTTDRDRALEELDREREARRRLELDFAVVQVKCQMKENQIEKLQAELRALRDRVGGGGGGPDPGGGGGGASQPAPAEAAAKLSLQCTLEVSRPGGCRVLEHNSWLGMLVASQPSQNTLFPGHGVRKINTLDMRAMQFVSLHQKQIRDIRFSPEQRDLLLSVSLDRRAKITNLCGNTLVQTYDCTAPVWSCAWDRDTPHTFYAGLQSGAVLGFDTRAGTEPLVRLEGGSPVVALRHVPRGGPEGGGGLLVCRLADCALQETAGSLRGLPLPLAGPFVSADYDDRTRHLLVSSRPSSRQPHALHSVCRLRRAAGDREDAGASPVVADVVQVFRGGTSQRVLSRSALVPHPLHPDTPLVCASQETAQLTQLWDLTSGECAVTLAASEPVLDACPLTAQDRHFLALLTDKAVKMYRWEVT